MQDMFSEQVDNIIFQRFNEARYILKVRWN